MCDYSALVSVQSICCIMNYENYYQYNSVIDWDVEFFDVKHPYKTLKMSHTNEMVVILDSNLISLNKL